MPPSTPLPHGAGTPAEPSLYMRHPLGLPAGSVRALLTLMVLGIFWTLVVISQTKEVEVPDYLYYLMFLMLGHYFAARGHTNRAGVQETHPLYLPAGTLRFLIIVGFLAVVGWVFYRDPGFFRRLKVADTSYLPLLVLAAFFVGLLVSRFSERVLAGPFGLPPWYQDIQAWISLLAVLGLAVEIIIRLVINPTLKSDEQLRLPGWEGALAAVIAFYFGVRS